MPKKAFPVWEPKSVHFIWTDNCSHLSGPVTDIDTVRLLEFSVSSQLMRQLAEAEIEPSHSENGWGR